MEFLLGKEWLDNSTSQTLLSMSAEDDFFKPMRTLSDWIERASFPTAKGVWHEPPVPNLV